MHPRGKNGSICPAQAPKTAPQGQKQFNLPRAGPKDCTEVVHPVRRAIYTYYGPQELKFDVIEDFPTFQDKRLYVLTACGIEMYGYTSYTYCKVGGKEVGTFPDGAVA
jgi:hypothetical protein